LGLGCIALTGAFPAAAQRTSPPVPAAARTTVVGPFNVITRQEVELLIADVAKSKPEIVKGFEDDPELKKGQLDNLKQLLSFATQAQTDGLANDPTNKQELENIRAEVTAVNYDREVNKDKAAEPFSSITDARVKEFWSKGGAAREAEFKRFVDAKITLLKPNDASGGDRQISDDERAQAREFFAKIAILNVDYRQKTAARLLPAVLAKRVALQVKLQQAQFLARLFAEKLAVRSAATDTEVAAYIAGHPELDDSKKRDTAESVLKRARSGEDFAKLANEFTEDPGNIGEGDKRNGGLYADVPEGMMIPAFERAALALEPGAVAPALVQTEYGYHIIKLERKSMVAGEGGKQSLKYDVRHILIATGYKDPADPSGRSVPVKTYARTQVAAEKEQRLIDKIVADAKVSVPDDFSLPGTAADSEQPKPAVKKAAPAKRPARKRS
jgi:parvulin-like peptidyl-prolyl isomerase